MVADDQAGFGRPPKKSQFKKGRSGNPKGRPPGSLNFDKVVKRSARKRVLVHVNGESKAITKLEAAVTQIANKAAAGDMNACKVLFPLCRSAEERLETNAPDNSADRVSEVDQKVMQNFLRRFEHTQPPEVEE